MYYFRQFMCYTNLANYTGYTHFSHLTMSNQIYLFNRLTGYQRKQGANVAKGAGNPPDQQLLPDFTYLPLVSLYSSHTLVDGGTKENGQTLDNSIGTVEHRNPPPPPRRHALFRVVPMQLYCLRQAAPSLEQSDQTKSPCARIMLLLGWHQLRSHGYGAFATENLPVTYLWFRLRCSRRDRLLFPPCHRYSS